MKKIKEKRGISLVALIITIIVLIILTGAVIMTMNKGDTIGKSKEAVFKNDITTYREELVNIKMNQKLKSETGEVVDSNLLSPIGDKAGIKAILPSFKDEYDGVLQIKDGELYSNVFLPTNNQYYMWLEELNIPVLWDNSQIGDFTIQNGVLTAYTGNNETVVIPDTVTELGSFVFLNSSMTSVKIPNTITIIPEAAFSNCTNLVSVEIPNSVTGIAGMAFENCTSLTRVTIPKSVTSIARRGVFDGSPITEFIIEAGSTLNISDAWDWGVNPSVVVFK